MTAEIRSDGHLLGCGANCQCGYESPPCRICNCGLEEQQRVRAIATRLLEEIR